MPHPVDGASTVELLHTQLTSVLRWGGQQDIDRTAPVLTWMDTDEETP